MGILKSGILGPFRKKVGTGIGRLRRGQNVLTALHRKSNKPATKKQLDAQLKFGLLNSFLSNIDKLVNIGFMPYAKVNSPVNTAYSYNWKHAFVNEGDTYRINYPQMVYSRGHVVTPEGVQAGHSTEGIVFSWLPQPQSAYCQFSDLASFLIYNPSKDDSMILINKVNRYALGYSMQIPVSYAGDTVHCYMNFVSANGKHNGDSVYIGEVEVA